MKDRGEVRRRGWFLVGGRTQPTDVFERNGSERGHMSEPEAENESSRLRALPASRQGA